MKRREGFIKVTGGEVWYEIVGEQKNTPLLVLHGGPGYPHDYLEPLENLSQDREVIFYDQLGCGNSEKPTDISLWTVERFVAELKEIISTLKLDEYHILGHSWGAGLAVSFALTKPPGIKSLILSDPYLSTPHWEHDVQKLLSQLPEETKNVLASGLPDSDAYKEAIEAYNHQFFWRLDAFSPAIKRANNKTNHEIYTYMWGADEFHASGNLKSFDTTRNLSEITVPVLLVCGKFDDPSPELTATFRSLFPNAHIEVFEESAHFPFWTEQEKYLKVVEDFLQKIT